MSSLDKELIALIIHFLKEEKFMDTMHKLEQQSGIFFNMKYLEEKVLVGDWDEVEKYLSGFTKVHDNKFSMKMFFEIRKQKYLEAVDRNDTAKAVEILMKDLREFSNFNEDMYKKLTNLLTLKNIRENEELSNYTDTKSVRNLLVLELRRLLEANPLIQDKLDFPALEGSRLRTLINQSLNWQHQLCKNPNANADIKTLLADHTCSSSNGPETTTPVTLPPVAIARPSSHAPQGANAGPFTPTPIVPNVNALAGLMANANPSTTSQSFVATSSLLPGPSRLGDVVNANISTAAQSSFATTSLLPDPSRHDGFTLESFSIPSHSRTPTALRFVETQKTDDDQQIKWSPSTESSNMVSAPPRQASLPLAVICTLYMKSTPTSMDFHPSLHSLLAVGCVNGGVSLWEAGLRERLIFKPFKIWNISACSDLFQAATAKDSSISIDRVLWSPKGDFVGVAFRKHLIQLYAYKAPKDLEQHLEIDAHVGSVNDLAFSYTNQQLCIVTCGDDELIKVWDLTGQKLFNFEGHEAAVYSVCPHQKENVQFIISNDVDGKIKIWLYGEMAPMVDYDAPGKWCTKMLYSADGSRLFSCGTSKDGDSFLVEWNESEGAIKRTYSGLIKKSVGIVQFDIAESHLLAVGEDNQIKFWDMDHVNVLTTTYAGGGLPTLPHLKFNKKGNLLAVTTQDSGLRILGNRDGVVYLSAIQSRSCEASKAPVVSKIGVRSMEKKPILDDVEKARELTKTVNPAQCRTLNMPDESLTPTSKVACLLYTNYGDGLLALGLEGIHKLWKWSRNELNPTGKATTNIVPQHWRPDSGTVMTNDVPNHFEAITPCVILSKNDSYVMSTSGGKISLFNMVTFKIIGEFQANTISVPPLPASFLAFHPQDNNIVAIGMQNSEIHIYYNKEEKVKHILKGHQKHVTGLAFSCQLNLLVSSSADAQLFFWSIDSWEKKKSLAIQMPAGNVPVGDTRVKFHINQVTLLVCHATQLAVYDASKMELIFQWMPQHGLSSYISSATFSCNGQLVYASFTDGNIGVFDSNTLKLRCCIASSAYLHQISSNSQNVYPLVIAAHPHEPNQFAIGLSDGSVKVIEPTEFEGRWEN